MLYYYFCRVSKIYSNIEELRIRVSLDLYTRQENPNNKSQHIRGGQIKNDGYRFAFIEISSPSFIKNPVYRYEMLDSNINSDEEILSIAKEYKKKFLQENTQYKGEFLFYFCGYGDPTNTKILRF